MGQDQQKGTIWHQLTRGEWAMRNMAISITLAFMLGWGTMLVLAVYRGRESLIVSGMFDTVFIMILSTLGVFVGGKMMTGKSLKGLVPKLPGAVPEKKAE